MHKPARIFNCISCQNQIIICSHCDCGQRYCSEQCSQTARKISCREADARYQKIRRGKHKHAERQRRYRYRQQQKQKIATDHTSLRDGSHDVLPAEPDEVAMLQTATVTDNNFCHFCKKPIADFLRRNFLGADRGNPSIIKLFRPKSLTRLN